MKSVPRMPKTQPTGGMSEIIPHDEPLVCFKGFNADRRRRDDAWRHIVEDLPDGDERDEFNIPRGTPTRSDKLIAYALLAASAACSLAFMRLAGVIFLGW